MCGTIHVALYPNRLQITNKKRSQHAEEDPLNPNNVDVDEHKIARLENTRRNLGSPKIDVRSQTHHANNQILTPTSIHRVNKHGQQIELPHTQRDHSFEDPKHVDDQLAVQLE